MEEHCSQGTNEFALNNTVTFFKMDDNIFVALNGPSSSFDILLNSIMVICVLFPKEGPGPALQQPLNILLLSRLISQLVYQTVIFIKVLKVTVLPLVSDFEDILLEIFYSSGILSLTSVTWLSFFYYISIVPNTSKCFIWIKRHIKMVVYVIIVLEKIFLTISQVLNKCEFIDKKKPSNSTALNTTHESIEIDETFSAGSTLMILNATYLLACMVIMTYSRSSTVVYLRRHMKSMADGSCSFSLPQLVPHMRVAVLGIIQCVTYIPLNLYTILIVVSPTESFFIYSDQTGYIYVTISSLFGTCSSICLGCSQSVFRKRFVMLYEGVWRCKKVNCFHK